MCRGGIHCVKKMICDEKQKILLQTAGMSALFYRPDALIAQSQRIFFFFFFACQLSIIEMMGPYQSCVQYPVLLLLLRIDVNGMLPWLGV